MFCIGLAKRPISELSKFRFCYHLDWPSQTVRSRRLYYFSERYLFLSPAYLTADRRSPASLPPTDSPPAFPFSIRNLFWKWSTPNWKISAHTVPYTGLDTTRAPSPTIFCLHFVLALVQVFLFLKFFSPSFCYFNSAVQKVILLEPRFNRVDFLSTVVSPQKSDPNRHSETTFWFCRNSNTQPPFPYRFDSRTFFRACLHHLVFFRLSFTRISPNVEKDLLFVSLLTSSYVFVTFLVRAKWIVFAATASCFRISNNNKLKLIYICLSGQIWLKTYLSVLKPTLINNQSLRINLNSLEPNLAIWQALKL